jgi:hypothetical protein
MRTFHVQPFVGVDGVQLGASRSVVHDVLGPPAASFMKTSSSRWPTDAWFESTFQVFYSGAAPTVTFIELSRNREHQVQLFGHSVFSVEVDRLVSALESHAAFDRSDPELGFSYVFPALELSLWRPTMDHPEDQFFRTVGIGTPGYYTRHDA